MFQQIANGDVRLAPDSKNGRLWDPSYKNFAPKVGFAWDVMGDGKTVVRGGYSISYERYFGNVTFNVIQNPPNYAVISLQDAVDVPHGGLAVTTNPAGPLSGSGIVKAIPKVSLRAVNPNIKQAYAELFSLTVEHQLGHNFLVGAEYSGSHGEHLYDIANTNRAGSAAVYLGEDPNVVGLGRLRSTQYSNIHFRSSDGISRYNALVARAQMNNLGKSGLTLNANYTFAHTFDELSDTFSSSTNQFNLGYLDAFNPRVDYGNSYLDIRHRFSLAAIWEVPFAKNTHGFVRQVADGWTVAPLLIIESGQPFSIFDCTNAEQCACTHGINRGPSSLVPTGGKDNFVYTPLYTNLDASGKLTASSVPLFDSSYCNAILAQIPDTCVSDFGPYPAAMNARNAFRGPGYWNADLGIYKSFFLSERFKLQFRAELYNAFNHANLYVQGGDTDASAGSGFVDAAKGFNPQLVNPTTGSNRTIQLALRLIF